MDHQTARDWIDETFFTPGVREANDAAARQALAHLAACTECAAYDEQTRRAALKLDMVRGPSPQVRTRLLSAAHRIGVARREATRPPSRTPSWRTGRAWQMAAAALVIAVVGVGAGAWWANLAQTGSDAGHLADAVAMMSALESQPGAHELVLRDAAGNGSGMAVVSGVSHEMAVFATHLPAGPEYHCYLEHAGKRTWIGHMYATSDVQFWAGDMGSDIEMLPGDLLIVAVSAEQPAVLSAAL